ncbi:cation:dicarboxylate symporter family transporter [Terrilactibacillus laevilacticus]|uniref:Cation:dicarboxylate symporter family transporter n=1 Tax=Terrilactibacillus laevilacticus TaxID=1380157 RepID=A0ABW5PLL2_9BACI|nr:cation:dicarboxylase symporter family transporter [Terrilactibacillus laevilacticus]
MQIVIGLILGIIVGTIFYGQPEVATFLQPIADVFLRAIKMIVVPIVLASIIVGVASVGDLKKVGKLGLKTIVYFEIISAIAIVIGLLFANIFQPGAGVDRHQLEKADISSYMQTEKEVEQHSAVDTFVNIVPTNIFESLANGDMLAIVFFAVIFGTGLTFVGERGKPVLHFFQGVGDTMFWVTNQVMKLAPFGVFALIGITVSKFGLSSLVALGKLTIVVYGSMIFLVFVVFLIVAYIAKIKYFSLLRLLKDEIILAYTTASSESVMPRLMQKLENYGCSKSIVSFVIPTGYTFNLDGSTLYQSITAIFIAQMYGMHMSISSQIMLVLMLMLTSKGIAGVPGASFVVLLATLGTVGIPLEGIAFIAGIERILDMARTAVNIVGNALATVVVSKWEGQYHPQVKKRVS